MYPVLGRESEAKELKEKVDSSEFPSQIMMVKKMEMCLDYMGWKHSPEWARQGLFPRWTLH